MARFDTPNVNVNTKTPEQNLQVLKGYLTQLAEELNVEIGSLETRIANLEKKEGEN